MSSFQKFSRFGLAFFALSLGMHAFAGCGTKAPSADIEAVPCTTPVNAEPEMTMGSRLRPYQLAANDGTTVRVQGLFFDSKLDTPCVFMKHEDGGELFCLPNAVEFKADTLFADANCKEPMAIGDACASVPKFAREGIFGSCYPPAAKSFRPLLEQLPKGATPYLIVNGVCQAQEPLPDTQVGFRVGEPMAWSEFVTASQDPMQPE